MKTKAICLKELHEIDSKLERVSAQMQSLGLGDGFEQKRQRLEKRSSNLEKKRKKVLFQLDESFRRYIERLDRKYNNGIVQITDAFCPGCKMLLPTQQASNLRKPDHFVVCSSCGRIIVSKPYQELVAVG